jgi:hypothetical protein
LVDGACGNQWYTAFLQNLQPSRSQIRMREWWWWWGWWWWGWMMHRAYDQIDYPR